MNLFPRLGARITHRIGSFRFASTSPSKQLDYAYGIGSDGRIFCMREQSRSTEITHGDVKVKWLSAGVDPIDFIVPKNSSSSGVVAGTEGVGIVLDTHPSVKSLKSGEVVIPIKPFVGTWCAESCVQESSLLPLPASVPVELAGTLTASPFTAYRLLRDFVKLSPGDVVVQNCASGPVGTAIVQIAHAFGLRTVSLVSTPQVEYAPTVERLKLLGGDVVIGESYSSSAGLKSILADLPRPKLGLNGSNVQGSVQALLDLLPESATVVSFPPGIASTRKFAYFSIVDWLDAADRSEVEEMVSELSALVEDRKLIAWLQRVQPDDVLNANTGKFGDNGRKFVISSNSM